MHADRHTDEQRSSSTLSSVYAGQAFFMHRQAQALLAPQNSVPTSSAQALQLPDFQLRNALVTASEDTAQSAGDEWVITPSMLGALEGQHALGTSKHLPTAEDSGFSAGSEWDSESSQLGLYAASGGRATPVLAPEDDPFTNGDQYKFPPPAAPPDFGNWLL